MSKFKNMLMKASALNGRTLGEYKEDKDGVAALEFALIAPILIMMYLGLLEVSMGIMADRDVSHATNVAGDLATQVEVLDSDEIIDIFTAAVTVMAPRPNTSGDINMLIESWDIDPDTNAPRSRGTAKLGAGTISNGGANLTDLQNMNLLTPTSGVVVATINYDYTPVGFLYFKENQKINLHETFVLKPRRSSSVPIEDVNGLKDDLQCSVDNMHTVTCT